MFTPCPNVFTGVPEATLRQWFASAQQALNDLITGSKGESYSYTQGDGSKSVTYTRANLDALQAYIGQLQYALGIRRRRALTPIF